MRIGTACILIGASFVLIAGALCQSQQPLRRPKQLICQSKQWITSNTVAKSSGEANSELASSRSLETDQCKSRNIFFSLYQCENTLPSYGAVTPWRLGQRTPSVFHFFWETLVSVHGRFPIARHALLTLLGCRRTPRHAGLKKVFKHAQNLFLGPTFEQRLSKTFTDRSHIVIQTLWNRSLR